MIGVLIHSSDYPNLSAETVFFDAIYPLSDFTQWVVLIMGTVLAASTGDALCYGISEVCRKTLPANFYLPHIVTGVTVAAACFFAYNHVAYEKSVFGLLMTANLVTAALSPCLFAGVFTSIKDRSAVYLGFVAAICVILVFWVFSEDQSDEEEIVWNLAKFALTASASALVTLLSSRLM